MRPRTRRAAVWATIVSLVVLGSSASSYAIVLTLVPVNQSNGQYEAGNSGVNGYSAASIAVTTVPTAVSVCTTGTKTIPLTGGSTNLVLSSTTGGSSCTAGDFSEEFTVPFAAIIGTQTNTFTVITRVAGGASGVNQETVTLGLIGLPLPMTATVHIYVDYGSSSQPVGGIEVLDLLIH
ncbi:MAG: hypothetical protein L3K08_09250 [Thermoplasmata archaeon]|nr:hypothetical protein [Thermoplasmata archaeon]